MDLTATKLFDIQGRNALATGGTSGIGLMMAKGLIANGIGTLYVTGNEPPEVFDQRIRVLHSFAQASGSNCVIYGCVSPCAPIYRQGRIGQVDLSRPDEIKKLSNFLHEQEDNLDILLSNAGIRRDPTIPVKSYSTARLAEIQESLLSHSHAAWGETFSVNSTAHFFLVAELLDLLGESAKLGDGRGCVVITSSCASMHNCTNVDLTSYAASKAATDHIVAMLAAKVGRFGIRVNGINPGCISLSILMLI